jgi:hypothetical protein
MQRKKKGAGGKLSRSEIIQARLNPKVRFAAELVATYERRTLSSLVESAVEAYGKTCKLNLELDGVKTTVSLDELLDKIWSQDEALRFMKTGFIDPELLGIHGYQLWEFILWTDYFWAHYEVTMKDSKGNFVEKQWTPYHHVDGLILENLKEYWDLIQTKEERAKINIPAQLGKKIDPPFGVITEDVTPYDSSKPIINREEQVERYKIWRENIHKLIKSDFEVIDTPEGEKTHIQMLFPTPEEQMEMVERIYQENMKCLSNSKK